MVRAGQHRSVSNPFHRTNRIKSLVGLVSVRRNGFQVYLRHFLMMPHRSGLTKYPPQRPVSEFPVLLRSVTVTHQKLDIGRVGTNNRAGIIDGDGMTMISKQVLRLRSDIDPELLAGSNIRV
jgi:hypothetical protein